MGYLILIGFVGVCSLIFVIAARGGWSRLLSTILSLLMGGLGIGLGYWLAFEGYTEWRGSELHQITYPVAGWIGIIFGGLVVVIGTSFSLLATKRVAKLTEELHEELDEERERKQEIKDKEQKSAKEAAKIILKRGEIGEYEEVFNLICDALAKEEYDSESAELLAQLQKFKK